MDHRLLGIVIAMTAFAILPPNISFGQFEPFFEPDPRFESQIQQQLPTIKPSQQLPEYLATIVPRIKSIVGQQAPDRLLPLATSIDSEYLRRAFDSIANQNAHLVDEVNSRYSLSTSQELIARWIGSFELMDVEQLAIDVPLDSPTVRNFNRPLNSHIDLVWTGEKFELRQYKRIQSFNRTPDRFSTSSLPIELTPIRTLDSLILSPVNLSNLFDFQVIVPAEGPARIERSFQK